MEEIIKKLAELLPFAATFEGWGLSKELSAGLASLVIALFGAAVKAAAKLIEWRRNRKAAQDLAPYFTYQQVKNSRALFIPTQFQNQSPTREEEPAFSHRFVSKSPLIPFFMKTAFNEKKESDKFYLVLADSGMGKTTFMINLYAQYTSRFNFRQKYQIRLFPFGDSRTLERVKQIDANDAPRTILLLDAFDEDKGLLPPETPDGLTDDERFRRRLDEIIEAVRDFREVVITSRTQYFPGGQEHEPYELKIPRFDDKGFHKLAKLYLSPFDPKEIKRYLNKKYGVLRFWNRKKKRAAAAIVNNSPKLMVRPMLLSYIDYLVKDDKTYANTFEIYETLIAEWIEREATKRKHKTGDREKFKHDLHEYSRLVAVEIYRQRQHSEMLHLNKDMALAVRTRHNIELQDYEVTGQSLLTRDAESNWKFAHKSIFEFLVAREALRDFRFANKLDFTGMDVARQFYHERIPEFVFIKGGAFLMGSPASEAERGKDETQHQVKVGDFYMAKHTVTLAQFETFIRESGYQTETEKEGGSFSWTGKNWKKKAGVNWRCDVKGEEQKDKQHPVIHVSWNDAHAYCKWLAEKLSAHARLPTEAEWEYACRAGTTTPFNTGENLTTEQANYDGNFPYRDYPKGKFLQRTKPVGSYPPNAWGLHEMHGNVYEWCLDWYDEKYYDECKQRGTVQNPTGASKGSGRVVRGGGWGGDAQDCRSADRDNADPSDRGDGIGFRPVFVP